jgi:thioredoxin reductase (NADPH)
MHDQLVFPIAIIGGGSAGIMAATRTVLNNDKTIIFPGTKKDRKRSRERWVKKVENVPGHLKYDRGISDPNTEHINWLKDGEFQDKITFLDAVGVVSLKKNNDLFEITASDEVIYYAKFVILATGITDIQPKIGDSIRDFLPYANKQTIDYCLRCDGHHIFKKETAIIGHYDSSAWVACMLYERYQVPNMMILTNGETPQFGEDVTKLIKLYNIDVYQEPIEQILGDVRSGALEGFVLCCGTSIHCQMAFVSLGMIIYNELAKSLGAQIDERGFVIADQKGQSSVEGLYVAGDLRANTKKQIYTAWDTAVDCADEINAIIRREKRNRLLNNL